MLQNLPISKDKLFVWVFFAKDSQKLPLVNQQTAS